VCKQAEIIVGPTSGHSCKMDSPRQSPYRPAQLRASASSHHIRKPSKQATRPISECAARIKGCPLAVRAFFSRRRNPAPPPSRAEPTEEERRWRRGKARAERPGRRRWSPGSTPSTSTSASTAGTSFPLLPLAVPLLPSRSVRHEMRCCCCLFDSIQIFHCCVFVSSLQLCMPGPED
jgi:hypothetical protein